MKILKYLKVWWIASKASAFIELSSRVGMVFFLTGKIVRFGLFFLFLYLLATKTSVLAGYTISQVLFFFLTFNLIDVTSQMLFREVYWFRPQIVTGNFDLVLSRPVNPLFRSLLGRTDILDLFTLPPLLTLLIIFAIDLNPTPFAIVAYLVFVVNAFIIAMAFHIAVLALGIVTTAIDHTIMIYRDIMAMGRIPIDFYREPIRGILTFAIPVGIMMTLPAKVFMGIFEWQIMLYAFLFSGVLLWVSLCFWHWSLKNYSSASS